MSWNARRFAAYLENVDVLVETRLFLTDNAITRLTDGRKRGALEPVPLSALPTGGVAFGLSCSPNAAVILPDADAERRVLNRLRDRVADDVVMLDAINRSRILGFAHADNSLSAAAVSEREDGSLSVVMESTARDGLANAADAAVGLITTAWAVFSEPSTVEAAALTVDTDTVVTNSKKRRATARGVRTADVSVIDVKRAPGVRYSGGTGRAIEHDHRWSVRGHWRRQPYGAGRAHRRLVWIDEQVRGPEDKPLWTPTKVHKL